MRIKAFLTQHRNDFTATMECEHCGHAQKLTTGYDDRNYHERVIPSMHCPSCGKNRAGEAMARITDREIQTLRNTGDVSEEAAEEIIELRGRITELEAQIAKAKGSKP
jgi:DNA repair exonuclease SbcCD ATPase subunit